MANEKSFSPNQIQLFVGEKGNRRSTEIWKIFMNIYAAKLLRSASNTLGAAGVFSLVPHCHCFFTDFPLVFPQLLFFPLFALPSRTFQSGGSGSWLRLWLLGVVLCERSRTRLIRHVRVLYELWPRREVAIKTEKSSIYTRIHIASGKVPHCSLWHINFAHQRYN